MSYPDNLQPYRRILQQSTLHVLGVCAMAVSAGGRWMLSSSRSQHRRLLVLTDTSDLSLHAVVNTGNIWATCIAWATGLSFFAGFNDGHICFGQFQIGKGITMLSAIYMPPVPQQPVTAIAFNNSQGYLAFSTAQQVVILERNSMAGHYAGSESGSSNYRALCYINPFRGTGIPINCLTFYATAMTLLIVGTGKGLAIYTMYSNPPVLCATDATFNIAQCAVSRDGRYLAAATFNHELVYWHLQVLTGPVLSDPVVIDLSKSPGHNPSSVPVLAITPANTIICGASTGLTYFFNTSTKKGYISRGLANHKIHAITAYGSRLYVMASDKATNATGSIPNRVQLMVYSQNKSNLDLSNFGSNQPRNWMPRAQTLIQPAIESTHPTVEPGRSVAESTYPATELTDPVAEPTRPMMQSTKETTQTPPAATQTSPAGSLRRRSVVERSLACSCYLILLATLVIPAIIFWHLRFVGFEGLVIEDLGDGLAFAGFYLIHFYVPGSWVPLANAVWTGLVCTHQLVIKFYM
ncbi:hypothetical protein FRC09_005495 [Ceratobasidium sp. 395]|nr:hypothetical protein FRC09_005495 [Ceratobasidium sp. 395]